jgi:hypothetical protein
MGRSSFNQSYSLSPPAFPALPEKVRGKIRIYHLKLIIDNSKPISTYLREMIKMASQATSGIKKEAAGPLYSLVNGSNAIWRARLTAAVNCRW